MGILEDDSGLSFRETLDIEKITSNKIIIGMHIQNTYYLIRIIIQNQELKYRILHMFVWRKIIL